MEVIWIHPTEEVVVVVLFDVASQVLVLKSGQPIVKRRDIELDGPRVGRCAIGEQRGFDRSVSIRRSQPEVVSDRVVGIGQNEEVEDGVQHPFAAHCVVYFLVRLTNHIERVQKLTK